MPKSKRAALAQKEILEVMDERNRPLAALSRSQVHSLGLRHRSVLVMMYNTSNQLFLQQRSPKKQSYPGCWDLSATGHVQLGESTQEAALRELAEELGVYTRRLYLVQEVPAGPQTGYEFVYLYSAGRLAQAPSPNPKEIQNWAFVHQNELDVTAESFAHLMTPGLLHFWRQGVLFS